MSSTQVLEAQVQSITDNAEITSIDYEGAAKQIKRIADRAALEELLKNCEFSLHLDKNQTLYALLCIPDQESEFTITTLVEKCEEAAARVGGRCVAERLMFTNGLSQKWARIRFHSTEAHYISLSERCLGSNFSSWERFTTNTVAALKARR